MNKNRPSRFLFSCGLLGATLLATSAFAISQDELAALRAKADSGNGIAQYNLGLIYADTKEPIADPIEAYVWLNLAADNGATGRAQLLLTSQLTPEQVADGKERLKKRRAELLARSTIITSAGDKSSPAATSPISAPSDQVSTPSSATSTAPNPVVAAPADSVVTAPQPELKKISAELANAWKENDQLKAQLAKNAQIAEVVEQLKRERDHLAASLTASADEVAKLRAAAANFEGERNALQQKIASAVATPGANSQLETLTAKLKTAEADLAKATATATDLAAAKQTIASLGEQLQKATAENQRLSSLSAESSAAIAEKNSAGEKEKVALREALSKAQAQATDAAHMKAAEASTKQQLDEAHTKLDAALRSYDLQQKEIDKLQKALANIDGERATLARQLTDARNTPAQADPAAQQKIAALTDELSTAKKEANSLRAVQTELSGERSRLKAAQEQLIGLSRQRDEMAKQLAAAEATPTISHAEFNQAKAELADAKARLAASESALAKVRAEKVTQAPAAVSLEPEVAALRKELNTAEDALAASTAERTAMQQRISILEKGAASPSADSSVLQKQLDETQMKLDTSLRSYLLQQNEIDRLQKALANIDEERGQLSDRLQAATTQANSANTQASINSDATAQLAATREQLRQNQNQLASLAAENAQLRSRLSSASTASSPLFASPTRPGSASTQLAASIQTPATPVSTPATAITDRKESPAEPRIHTVAEGDTLTRISKRYYGTSERWAEILAANRDVIRDPKAISVGLKLKIP